MREQTPDILPIFGPSRNTVCAAVPQRGGKSNRTGPEFDSIRWIAVLKYSPTESIIHSFTTDLYVGLTLHCIIPSMIGHVQSLVCANYIILLWSVLPNTLLSVSTERRHLSHRHTVFTVSHTVTLRVLLPWLLHALRKPPQWQLIACVVIRRSSAFAEKPRDASFYLECFTHKNTRSRQILSRFSLYRNFLCFLFLRRDDLKVLSLN